MGKNKEPVEVDVEVVGKSENALQVSDGDTTTWIPISLIDEDSDINGESDVGASGTLTLPEWKAKDAGFI